MFVRLRDDVAVDACEAPPEIGGEPPAPAAPAPAEAAKPRAAPEHKLQLTRLDKVFWPVEGYTKGDLLAYYEAAWPWLAPYLRDRPLVLTRYPDGIEEVVLPEERARLHAGLGTRQNIEDTDYFVCNGCPPCCT